MALARLRGGLAIGLQEIVVIVAEKPLDVLAHLEASLVRILGFAAVRVVAKFGAKLLEVAVMLHPW